MVFSEAETVLHLKQKKIERLLTPLFQPSKLSYEHWAFHSSNNCKQKCVNTD